jgi:L-threonylcarbamoyladenylate synthase
VPETHRRALDIAHPDPQVIEQAARVLQDGEIVAAPSDTVYGLLGLSRSRDALVRLAALKERPGPFIVLVAGWEEARSWTRGVPASTWERLRRVWPGPLTAILPTDPGMPGTAEGRVGLRMPRSPLLEALLAAVGEPLFSTSANRRGSSPASTVAEVLDQFPQGLALVLDGGPAQETMTSTVVDLCVSPPRILRPGLGDAGPLLDPAPPPS